MVRGGLRHHDYHQEQYYHFPEPHYRPPQQQYSVNSHQVPPHHPFIFTSNKPTQQQQNYESHKPETFLSQIQQESLHYLKP